MRLAARFAPDAAARQRHQRLDRALKPRQAADPMPLHHVALGDRLDERHEQVERFDRQALVGFLADGEIVALVDSAGSARTGRRATALGATMIFQ